MGELRPSEVSMKVDPIEWVSWTLVESTSVERNLWTALKVLGLSHVRPGGCGVPLADCT